MSRKKGKESITEIVEDTTFTNKSYMTLRNVNFNTYRC